MKPQQSGFTLIEIAVVLVIIGLLLGGVLGGQQLIQSARVRNIIDQQTSIQTAMFGFQDRYNALPGDYSEANATANIPNVTVGGNGNGLIESVAGVREEQTMVWTHLSNAGFITGTFNVATTTATPAQGNTPVNAFGGFVQLIHDNVYASSATTPIQRNIKTGNNIPAALLAEIDRKVDDGNPRTGRLRFSAFGPADPACLTAGDLWDAANNPNNCGSASLF